MRSVKPEEAPSAAASQRAKLQRQSQGDTPGGTASPAEDCETVGYQDVKKNRPAPEGNRRRTATRMLTFAVERGDRLHDVLKLFVGKFSVDGKREHFFGRTFRLRERALLIPQITITILQMQGQGIIDL